MTLRRPTAPDAYPEPARRLHRPGSHVNPPVDDTTAVDVPARLARPVRPAAPPVEYADPIIVVADPGHARVAQRVPANVATLDRTPASDDGDDWLTWDAWEGSGRAAGQASSPSAPASVTNRDAHVRAERRFTTVTRVLAATAMVIVGGFLGVVGWLASTTTSALNDMTLLGPAAVAQEQPKRDANPLDLLNPEPLRGESSGRVNVLMVGTSFDKAGHSGATLTDSIMVGSFDVATDKVTLVSIPRDLWVVHDGRGMRINAIYQREAGSGGEDGLGDTAAGLYALADTVTDVTGLPIHHHVLVGYTALEDTVDALGGVTVTVDATDSRGIWDPNTGLRISNGDQHVDGETALALARARNHPEPGQERPYGVSDGDFGRARNQQAVLSAIADKAVGPQLANPATLSSLLNTVGSNVRADLSVGQIRRALDLGRSADRDTGISIRGGDGATLLVDYRGPNGEAALAPRAGVGRYDQIRAFVNDTINPPQPVPSPAPSR